MCDISLSNQELMNNYCDENYVAPNCENICKEDDICQYYYCLLCGETVFFHCESD